MEGVLQILNRPKALLVVMVIAFIINGLLFYRYQHKLSEAAAAEPSAVATATPTSFAVPAGQKESSSAKEADGKKKRGILATALSTLRLDRSLGSPQGSSLTPYVPLSHLSALSLQENRNAQTGTDPSEAPPTEEVVPASNRTVDEPAADEAASAKSGPASVPDQKQDAAPREPLKKAPTIAPPAPEDDSHESADDAAPKGALRETALDKESAEGEAAPPELPPDEKPSPPSAPAEQPGPPLAPKSQAQCTNGGFAVFGFENEDDCLRFVAPRGESEPAKGQKD